MNNTVKSMKREATQTRRNICKLHFSQRIFLKNTRNSHSAVIHLKEMGKRSKETFYTSADTHGK